MTKQYLLIELFVSRDLLLLLLCIGMPRTPHVADHKSSLVCFQLSSYNSKNEGALKLFYVQIAWNRTCQQSIYSKLKIATLKRLGGRTAGTDEMLYLLSPLEYVCSIEWSTKFTPHCVRKKSSTKNLRLSFSPVLSLALSHFCRVVVRPCLYRQRTS
jgi:hypothetical protein